MKKLACFIVDQRYKILLFVLALAAVCALLIPRVEIVTDMSGYLPDDSPMKTGLEIIKDELGGLTTENSIRVMFTDLPSGEDMQIKERLSAIPGVSSVGYLAEDEQYCKPPYTMFSVNTMYDFGSKEIMAIEQEIKKEYSGYHDMVYHVDTTTSNTIPPWILVAAVAILLTILWIMSPSFVEPLLFIVTIGIAVLINMGSNILMGSVSQTTNAIGSILQLALSMDYSIMLMEYYRQERNEISVEKTSERSKDAKEQKNAAMKSALEKAFRPVTGSSITTVVGLLMLVFMSFKIGEDMGIVLAKGVFISLLCVFTVLPVLILSCENAILKTMKPVPHFPTGAVEKMSFRFRKIFPVLLLGLFALVFFLRGNTNISYTLVTESPIDDVFVKNNAIVLLYSNEDEDTVSGMIEEYEEDENVRSVSAFANTLGKAFTGEELLEMAAEMGMEDSFTEFLPGDMEESEAVTLLDMLIGMCSLSLGRREETPRVTILELLDFIVLELPENPLIGNMISDEMIEGAKEFHRQIAEGIKRLKGPEHSLMALQTTLPDESEETEAFIRTLEERCKERLTGEYYLIGNSVMAYEMSGSFTGELNRITILTALAIFLVVVFTFRSVLIPVILVLLIQTAVYATVVIMGIQGQSMYYLAYLIVQSILMGATIDYAILYTNYYRESRKTADMKTSIQEAYRKSIHTILTSGLIIVIVTAILGYAFGDPSILQICHTIAKGASCSLILILFVLPGTLAALDNLIIRESRGQVP